MRCYGKDAHNATLALMEARDAANAKWRDARGRSRRKAKIAAEAAESALALALRNPGVAIECDADSSFGVADESGRRISHYTCVSRGRVVQCDGCAARIVGVRDWMGLCDGVESQ